MLEAKPLKTPIDLDAGGDLDRERLEHLGKIADAGTRKIVEDMILNGGIITHGDEYHTEIKTGGDYDTALADFHKVREEGVFRHLFARVWVERKGSPIGLYAASSVAFGLLHLPQGRASVVFAALAGLLLMWLYRRTGSLWPPVVVHYLVNLVVFSDLACVWEIGGPCAG